MIRRPQDDHRYAQVSASDDDASSDDNRGPAHLDGQKAPGPATRFVIAPRSAPLRWALAAVADRRNGTSTLCVRVGLAALLLPSVAFLILAAATIARGGAGALLAGGEVVSTISKGIIDPSLVEDSEVFILAMMAALVSAARRHATEVLRQRTAAALGWSQRWRARTCGSCTAQVSRR